MSVPNLYPSVRRHNMLKTACALSGLYFTSSNGLPRELAALLAVQSQSVLADQASGVASATTSMLAAYLASPKGYRAMNAMMMGLYNLFGRGAKSAAPTVRNSMSDQAGDVGVPFDISFRSDEVFADSDGDTLSLTATKDDGSPLPSWFQLKAYPQQMAYDAALSSSTDVYVNSAGSRALVTARTHLLIYDLTNSSQFGLLNSLLVHSGDAWGVDMIE